MPLHSIILLLAVAQAEPAVHKLSTAQILPHEFSLIRGIRELPDGRLLVSDWIEEIVVVVDFRTGTVRQLSRKGSGPLEYRLPGTLIALPRDSTLLLDEGNSRFAVVGPDLRIVRSYSNVRAGLANAIYPRAVDRLGRIYFTIPAWAERSPLRGDSVVIARWNPQDDRLERLIPIKGSTPRSSSRTMGIPHVIFAPQDGWQADPDGRLILVRADRYRIESRSADGRVSSGPATPYRPLETTRKDRIDYITRFLQGSPISGRGKGASGLGHAPASMNSPEMVARMVETQEFAPMRPAFTDRGPWLAPDGLLWVERSVARGAAPLLDRFDGGGLRRASVALPAGRRLVAVGRSGVYAAAADADGIERLERYPLPPR